MRELCYISQAVGSCAMSGLFITIDLLFCGLSLYIVAMYESLQKVLQSIDQESNHLQNENEDNKQKHRQSLCDCIDNHLAIIR